MRHGLTDEQWNAIDDIFPEPAATGRPLSNPRKMLEARIWINNTGAKWRDLPAELGAWQTVFKHFDRWNDDGTFQKIVDRLTQHAVDDGGLDNDLWCIDGTILRAHRCAAGGAKKGTQRNRLIMHASNFVRLECSTGLTKCVLNPASLVFDGLLPCLPRSNPFRNILTFRK